MSKKHATLSPSSAARWTTCTASPLAQEGYPNTGNSAAWAGTTCHQIQEELLKDPDVDPQIYVGATLFFWQDEYTGKTGETWGAQMPADPKTIDSWVIQAEVVVTQEMVDAVGSAVAYILEHHTLFGGELLVEKRVPIGQFTGEENAFGSADVILLGPTWIHVIDSKFGRMRVDASTVSERSGVHFVTGVPTPETRTINLQMACYALGAVYAHDVFGTVETVTVTIVQPFINHTDSYTCSMADLRETEKFLADKAQETRTAPVYKPSYEACLFCRAKGECTAQSALALSTVFDGFGETEIGYVNQPNPLTLGSQYALVPFVAQWVKDVEAATVNALENGTPVTRNDGMSYKLVAGKAGARQWVDDELAERELQRLRLKREDMYSYKVVSPTQAEKLAKVVKGRNGAPDQPPVLGPRQWENIQALMKRNEGKPRIVLETDSKSSLVKADGFDEVPL